MFGLGLPEIIVLVLVLLLLFGTKYLPKISKDIGDSGRAFKESFTDGKNDKSLQDIAKEVGSSAQKIKRGVDVIRNTRI